MEGEWLAYLEYLAQREAVQELRQEPAPVAGAAAPAKSLAKSVLPSPFVCEEPPSE
jgi:hypothetical protein